MTSQDYIVETIPVHPILFAAVQKSMLRTDLSTSIISSLDVIYAYLKEHAIKHDGTNIVVYLDGLNLVQTGVQVPQAFEGAGNVICASTPAGMAVHTTHWGAYRGIGKANEAIREYGQGVGLALNGPSWEVYGHWNDDPAKVRTDIYYLVSH